MDNEIDRRIYITAILFQLVQNRQQTHDCTLIGSGAWHTGVNLYVTCLIHNGTLLIPWFVSLKDKGLKGKIVIQMCFFKGTVKEKWKEV